jgi:hypothetical protein
VRRFLRRRAADDIEKITTLQRPLQELPALPAGNTVAQVTDVTMPRLNERQRQTLAEAFRELAKVNQKTMPPGCIRRSNAAGSCTTGC